MPASVVALGLWGALAAAAAAPAVKNTQAKPKMAVLDVEVKNIDADTGAVLTEVLVSELTAQGSFDIISSSEIKTMLGVEQQKQLLGCAESSCMAELGGALGAELLVVSQVGLVGKTYVVSVKLIDTREVKAVNRVSENVEGEVDAVLEALRRSVPKLLGRPATGGAAVTAAEKGGGVPVLPIALLAGGAVVAGVGGVMDGLALAQHNTVKSSTATRAAATAAANDGRTFSTVAVVLYGVGAATAITGLVLWLVSGDDQPQKTAIAPWIGPDVVGATLWVMGW